MQPYPTFQNYSYNPFLMNGLAQNNYNQPMQQQLQPQAQMAGKFVGDFNEVTANDVPMDGRSAVFVKNDKSEIQVREWSPNGQIVLTSYLPHIETFNSNTQEVSGNVQKSNYDLKSEILDPLFERIEQLEDKLDRLSKPTSSRTAKKDGE